MSLEVAHVQPQMAAQPKSKGIAKNIVVASACLLGGAALTSTDYVDFAATKNAVVKGVEEGTEHYAQNQDPKNYLSSHYYPMGPGMLLGGSLGSVGALLALIFALDKRRQSKT
ncbi:MAG: hypothetical protein HY094_04830 [Candidatus Melainabacteria bacterium]|nr:hypothetical protein [Candidatus Melainabacteria bacterium]